MKNLFTSLSLLLTFVSFSQNIQVDSQTYTPQQLIEDILIDSDCIENVVVTNVIGGNFNNTDQSYGYFDATNTSFPFSRGIVLSTGRLANVPGPNNTLSDDDAPNWFGDADLEFELQEQNTLNATIIEFEFTAVADRISFRYIFASEEYQENNPNTCEYSDLFGFLIRPASQQQYTNIAVVPNTSTPVKVTTVHPDIPGGCPAQNETYFGSFNGANAPINFNGQTAILTATHDVIPNKTYHVKLVIADEQNYRYDSAVFLDAGSFELNTNLGPDRLLATNNPLCENETITLDATQPGINSYRWFKDGVELLTETNPTLNVIDAGHYQVEVTLGNTCISYGEITIEYSNNPVVSNTQIIECDPNSDGLTTYNLTENYVTSAITNNDNNLSVTAYFTNTIDASQNTNAIINPSEFNNTIPGQIVFASVENEFSCSTIVQITLQTSSNIINIAPIEVCDDISNDGIANFDLDYLRSFIAPLVPVNSSIEFYTSINDIFNNTPPLNSAYENLNRPYSDSIFAEVITNNGCFSIIEVPLVVYDIPELAVDETVFYCLNEYPTTITLENGAINIPVNSNYTYSWDTGEITPTIDVNAPGEYVVTVTNENNCSNSRTITVAPSNTATIDDIVVVEATPNNSVTIEVSGEGDYEYSLDLGPYQDSNHFSNVAAGFRSAYVRDKNGCGVTEQLISVLGFPKFFTPNGDGYKDTWQLYGVNSQFNQGTVITVFDRFGKLIKTFTNNSPGWDGTLNGKSLPTSDYWFVAKFADGKEYRGHFTLKR